MLEALALYRRLAPFIGVLVIPLLILLIVQKGETRHWKKQSGAFEQLYHQEQAAFATTVANYRAAADQARAEDQANARRVAAEQGAINERTSHDFETRLAAARAAAQRLRTAAAAADPGAGRNASVPGLSAPAVGPVEGACDRLSDGHLVDPKLCATEQGIRLDELIKWTIRQHTVDPNAKPSR